MSASARTTFGWADGTYTFRLPIAQLEELQDLVDAGPYEVWRRLTDGRWRVQDLRHVIRLGLIGGGLEPARALVLTQRYVEARPLVENVQPALAILSAALFGSEDDPVGKPAEEESQGDLASSASPPSTATEQ